MDFVELEVLRMMSAPPACGKVLFRRGQFHPRRARGSTCLCQGEWENGNGLKARCLRVLHCEVFQGRRFQALPRASCGWGSAHRSPL